MSKWRVFTLFILLALFVIPVSAANGNNGVDDIRGRWDIQWQMDSEGNVPLPELEVLVTEIEPSSTEADVYLATGCMAIAEEGYYAPLSLQATDNLDGSYDVVFLSTVVPGVNGMGPFIVRFDGYFEVFGSGVKDDVIDGGLETGYGGGGWTGEHHDRRRVKCPAADPSVLWFNPDIYVDVDRSPTPNYPDYTLLGGNTNIVSSAMLVEWPDGGVEIVDYEQDIFTLADFVNEFAFGLNLEGLPIAGEPYTFTLLDSLGNTIPGTETVDYWYSCPQGAPSDPVATYLFEDHVNTSWTGVADVPGQFEPNGDPQIGFYQIEVGSFEEGGMLYGMNWGSSTYHNIPWSPFVVDQFEDDPDGFDHGISFSELDDGLYEYRILSFSESHRDNPGFGHECQSVINAQNLMMEKSGSDLNFFQFGLISGNVASASGPIEGIMVTVCEYDNEEDPYCQEGQTDSNGEYYIQRLFENDYRVGVYGQPGWANENYDDAIFHEDAARVGVLGGQETTNIDFILEQGGSISGTVFDDQQNPLGGIAVDTENGGFGTCTDENGFYVLEGMPLGDVGVVAGRDFCDEHPYVDQLIEDVPVGSTGVDFYLSEGLYISGTVFDDQQNPLGGIAVDTENGGFGTCTDENGFYILGALSAGDYNVVAGRDFCDEHPYAEQMQEGVAAGSENIDFQLEMYVEPSSQYLNVQPDHMWADTGEWAEGVEVTISFDGYFASQFAPPSGNLFFDLSESGIAAGADVHITDGTDFKDLHVVNATLDTVDDVENTAEGSAPADSWLGVGIQADNGFFWADNFQADGVGNWFVDFDDTFQDFDGVTDAWVHVFDEDGDSTLAHLFIDPPPEPSSAFINLNPDDGWAHSGGWAEGSPITLSFLGSDWDTLTADAAGDVFFNDLAGSGVGPGVLVSVTDGVDTKELLVVDASFDFADDVTDTAGGTGPAGVFIAVGIDDGVAPEPFRLDGIQIDSSGNWFADFGADGQDFGPPVNGAWVEVPDEDGDSTLTSLVLP